MFVQVINKFPEVLQIIITEVTKTEAQLKEK